MEQEAFDRLVGDLYHTVVDPSSWAGVMRDLRCTFGASHVSLQHGRKWGAGYRNRSWSTDASLSEQINRWSIANERVPVSSVSLRVGEVSTDQRLVERKSFARTDYFNEILVPFDASKIMMIKIAESPGPTINVLRGNGQAEFSDADLVLARRVSYHAVQAIRGRAALGHQSWCEFIRTVDDADNALVLVDERGDVLHMNARAAALTRLRDGVLVRHSQMGAAASRADRQLRHAIWKATAGPDPRPGSVLTVDRASCARSLIVRVTPVAGRAIELGLGPRLRAIVSILDPERVLPTSTTDELRQIYGITRREADVVNVLATGATIAEAAARCGVTLATARNYLARALRKTELNRQQELISLIQRMSGLREESQLSDAFDRRLIQTDRAL